MKSFKKRYEELVASEAFLKRASTFEHPFVLKGSLLTRQYVIADFERYVEDIDWVYPLPLKSAREAEKVFGDWIKKVTEIDIGDGIEFELFEGSIVDDTWSWVDYVGNTSDFPTIKTYINGSLKTPKANYNLRLSLDISFNIELGVPPVQVYYKPLFGEAFTVPKAVTLSQQVAWKLHQTITRPRYKDIYDLVYLMPYIQHDSAVKEQIVQELVNECIGNGDDINQLKWFISEKAIRYAYLRETQQMKGNEFKSLKNELNQVKKSSVSRNFRSFMYQELYGKTGKEPLVLSELLTDFRIVLIDNGFTLEMFENLPPYSRKKLNFIAPEPDLYMSKENIEEDEEGEEFIPKGGNKSLTFMEKLKRFLGIND